MATVAEYKIAIRTQFRVIFALILRETRVTYGATSLGYFWAIAEPVFGTLLLVIVFSAIAQVPPLGSSFALFFATGILLFQTWRKLAASLMNVFTANKGLFAYPLVKTTDVIYARSILISVTSLMVLFVFFATLTISLDLEPPKRVEDVLLAFLATIMLGAAGGINNAIIATIWPTWQQLEAILARPMFFISGVFFIPAFFPVNAQYWLSWNPVLHCIEWFREGYYGYYESPVLDKGFLVICIGILTFAGFLGERIYRKKITE